MKKTPHQYQPTASTTTNNNKNVVDVKTTTTSTATTVVTAPKTTTINNSNNNNNFYQQQHSGVKSNNVNNNLAESSGNNNNYYNRKNYNNNNYNNYNNNRRGGEQTQQQYYNNNENNKGNYNNTNYRKYNKTNNYNNNNYVNNNTRFNNNNTTITSNNNQHNVNNKKYFKKNNNYSNTNYNNTSNYNNYNKYNNEGNNKKNYNYQISTNYMTNYNNKQSSNNNNNTSTSTNNNNTTITNTTTNTLSLNNNNINGNTKSSTPTNSTTTTQKNKKRNKQDDDDECDEYDYDDTTMSSNSSNNQQQQLTFDNDDYIIGFASINGNFYFCWQQAKLEEQSQSKIKEILTYNQQYHSTPIDNNTTTTIPIDNNIPLIDNNDLDINTINNLNIDNLNNHISIHPSTKETNFSLCVKNKQIYANLKKFIKKLIKQNQPYQSYLINSNQSILMKQFLVSSNTWLEFAMNLPFISNKFAKLKAKEVKRLLAMYSTEWNYIEHLDLRELFNLYINNNNTINDNNTINGNKLLEYLNGLEIKTFKRRSHLLSCSWVCKCPNGKIDVFNELLNIIKIIIPNLNIFEKLLLNLYDLNKNNNESKKMTICDLVLQCDSLLQSNNLNNLNTLTKYTRPETSIFSEIKRISNSNFTNNFIKELSIIISLNIFQSLKYKFDFSHKKQKSFAANDFKKLYMIVDVDTQKQKTAFNAKIQQVYLLFLKYLEKQSFHYKLNHHHNSSNSLENKEEEEINKILDENEKMKLINELIQFITFDKEYRCYQRYYDLLKTEEDDTNRTFGWFQSPYQLKAIQLLKYLNFKKLNWIEIYLNRIHAKNRFDDEIVKEIERECDNNNSNYGNNRMSFLHLAHMTFTIDKKGTMDCDDAFTILYYDNCTIQIAIHITDVASTILRNVNLSNTNTINSNNNNQQQHAIFQSAIFREAEKRIQSIYVPGNSTEQTYAPLLPKTLSEERLSLIDQTKPKEVISHIFQLSINGNVEFKGVTKGIIQVGNANNFFFQQADEKIDSPYAEGYWKLLYDCCCEIHNLRLKNGAKKFTPGVLAYGEVNLKLNKLGTCTNKEEKNEEEDLNLDNCEIEVHDHKQTPSKSSRIITEFSILLNATMAKFFYENGIVGLYKEFYQTYHTLLPENIKEMNIEEFINVASLVDLNNKNGNNEMNYLAQNKLQQLQNYNDLLEYENELKLQNSRHVTNIGKITTNPRKFNQNIIGVELYMQISSPLRRWLDLVLQLQLVHFLNTIENNIFWTGPEMSLFSEDLLHFWSEKVSDKIQQVKDMERQVMYHYMITFLFQQFNNKQLNNHLLLPVISEINFRKGKRVSKVCNVPDYIDLNNLVRNDRPIITQLLRLRLVNYNYFAMDINVTSNTVHMDEITIIKVIEVDPYTHTIHAEMVI